jgi:CBS domain-containing protein
MCKACDPKTLTVHQIMEDAVVTAGPKATGNTLAQILSERNFGSVPIVEEDRTLVGLVSEFDLLKAMDEGKDLKSVTAADIMTKGVVTATEGMTVPDVSRLLKTHSLIRVPVVKDGTLVGVLARRDIVYGYMKATATYWP